CAAAAAWRSRLFPSPAYSWDNFECRKSLVLEITLTLTLSHGYVGGGTRQWPREQSARALFLLRRGCRGGVGIFVGVFVFFVDAANDGIKFAAEFFDFDFVVV